MSGTIRFSDREISDLIAACHEGSLSRFLGAD